MKPTVTLHMLSSLDGRITPEGWPANVDANETYEALHRDLRGDAWLVGRVTMAEFARGEPRLAVADQAYPRQTWRAPVGAKGPYAVCLDAAGRLHLNRDRVNGDPLIIVLTNAVSDDLLAELRRDGISYLFAGETEIDLAQALSALRAEFGIASLLLEGGGAINGAFLAAGLIDAISVLILPIADGKSNTPTLFDHNLLGARELTLTSVEQLGSSFLYLRYRVVARGESLERENH